MHPHSLRYISTTDRKANVLDDNNRGEDTSSQSADFGLSVEGDSTVTVSNPRRCNVRSLRITNRLAISLNLRGHLT